MDINLILILVFCIPLTICFSSFWMDTSIHDDRFIRMGIAQYPCNCKMFRICTAKNLALGSLLEKNWVNEQRTILFEYKKYMITRHPFSLGIGINGISFMAHLTMTSMDIDNSGTYFLIAVNILFTVIIITKAKNTRRENKLFTFSYYLVPCIFLSLSLLNFIFALLDLEKLQ